MRSLLVACAVALAACGPPAPAYDATIDAQAIPVAPGALAGRFALFIEAATFVSVPIPGVGPQPGGGDSWFLVTRTYDAKAGYHETHRLCGGRIWDVMGTTTTISDAARRRVPAEPVRSVTVSPPATTPSPATSSSGASPASPTPTPPRCPPTPRATRRRRRRAGWWTWTRTATRG